MGRWGTAHGPPSPSLRRTPRRIRRVMSTYIVRRLLLNVLVLWMVATIVFFAVRILDADYVDKRLGSNLELSASNPELLRQARAEFGLDKPKWQQYFIFMGELVRG